MSFSDYDYQIHIKQFFLYPNRVRAMENLKFTKLNHMQITIVEENYQTILSVAHN